MTHSDIYMYKNKKTLNHIICEIIMKLVLNIIYCFKNYLLFSSRLYGLLTSYPHSSYKNNSLPQGIVYLYWDIAISRIIHDVLIKCSNKCLAANIESFNHLSWIYIIQYNQSFFKITGFISVTKQFVITTPLKHKYNTVLTNNWSPKIHYGCF